MTPRRPVSMFSQPPLASFPRVAAPANAASAQPSAALPLVSAYDPPIPPAAPPSPALPTLGITDDIEAKELKVIWPSSNGLLLVGEVPVYTTQKQWRALDVFIQDANLLRPGMILGIRVYAVSANAAPVLVASGRVGHQSLVGGGGGSVLRLPLWVVAARAQAKTFFVTFRLENTTGAGLPAASGQFSLVTVVGSNEANEAPPLIGAVKLSPSAATGSAQTAIDAELVMLEAALTEAVAAPRYLQIHETASGAALAGRVPQYCFPLGAGVAANGGGQFGSVIWFPPGLRPTEAGAGLYQIGASSTAATFTAAADVMLQGLYR